MSAFILQTAAWRAGLASEMQFWQEWVSKKGLDWKKEFDDRINGNANVKHYLEGLCRKQLSFIQRNVIIDVGAGPITQLSTNDTAFKVYATDPLAAFYKEILDGAGIVPPVYTTFATAEDLSSFFAADLADVVHCGNALDHSFDPIRGIEEMLVVSKPEGCVVLRHHPNEAQAGGYDGLHQWNFETREGRFLIWNKDGVCDVANHFAGIASCTSYEVNGNVVAVLKKQASGISYLHGMADKRRRDRLKEISEGLMTSLIFDAKAQMVPGR